MFFRFSVIIWCRVAQTEQRVYLGYDDIDNDDNDDNDDDYDNDDDDNDNDDIDRVNIDYLDYSSRTQILTVDFISSVFLPLVLKLEKNHF